MASNRKASAHHHGSTLLQVKPEGYEKHKYKIAVIMGRFMLHHLNSVYREFSGDLVQAIVLGEIGHHNITSYYSGDRPKPGMNESIWDEPYPWKNLRPCNAFSISEATGIPRETVRRKIAALAQKGWVKSTPNSQVAITAEVRNHFVGGFNVRFCRDLLDTAERIRNLLKVGSSPSDEGVVR
jgi:predicted transcriptional regulator